MVFEFDPAKSASNRTKHGIDFEAAQALWRDPERIEVPARDVYGERRTLVIGRVGDHLWSAVITYRDRGNCVRLISVRRARHEEARIYHRP